MKKIFLLMLIGILIFNLSSCDMIGSNFNKDEDGIEILDDIAKAPTETSSVRCA